LLEKLNRGDISPPLTTEERGAGIPKKGKVSKENEQHDEGARMNISRKRPKLSHLLKDHGLSQKGGKSREDCNREKQKKKKNNEE